MTRSILILGGTADARILAGRLCSRSDHRILLSMAGRTKNPVKQPVPMRIGGFGGAEGLARFIQSEAFDVLVDATHPYAAIISANAVKAADMSGVPLITLARPAWTPRVGDSWTKVADVEAAVSAIDGSRRKVFLALGRQELLPFEAAPIHDYLIRSVDPVDPPLNLLQARYITARGPFALKDEMAMLGDNAIEVIVSKNSGGTAAYAKIEAARKLGIPVIMIDRPLHQISETVPDIDAALIAIHHQLSLLEKRGV